MKGENSMNEVFLLFESIFLRENGVFEEIERDGKRTLSNYEREVLVNFLNYYAKKSKNESLTENEILVMNDILYYFEEYDMPEELELVKSSIQSN